MLKNQNVVFCYFDEDKKNYVEVSGNINPYDYASFRNEVYHLKLDMLQSEKMFFKDSYSTADLIDVFHSKSGIIDLTSIYSLLTPECYQDDRLKNILRSYFSKIEITRISNYSSDQWNTLIRESANPIFEQPSTYNQINKESISVPSNTKMLETSKYDFKLAHKLQQEMFKTSSHIRPYMNVKIS